MRGSGGEPVEVWLGDGRPARFVWRGRMYTVMFVLDRFVLDRHMTPAGPPADQAAALGDGRECWRVEATPERVMPPTMFELCHDLAADRWTLSRR
jgi:hypothetical protein